MNFKTSKQILIMGLLVAIALLVGAKVSGEDVLGYVGIGLMFIAFSQAVIFFRCPKCKASLLRKKGAVLKKCPKCGRDLSK
jgi:hypothetical protein